LAAVILHCCRDGVRKAKAQMELILARDAKKSGFYRYVSQKRKVKESVSLLMIKNGNLVSTDEEKAEVLNNSLLQSSLTTSLPTPLDQMDGKTGAGRAKSLPLSEKIRLVST